jgi:hypothetical protein
MSSTPSIKLGLQRVSGNFVETIRDMAERATASVSSRIAVTDELGFWYMLEFGTRAYTIRPVEKKALHFEIAGREVFAHEVHHPGVRAKLVYRAIRSEWIEQLAALHLVERLANDESIAPAIDGAMDSAKELMALRLEQVAPGHHEDGKLKGKTAAEAWREDATVITVSTEF